MDAMLDSLKPRFKKRVIDLVEAAGVNVHDWRNSPLGASNPRYCYQWAAIEEGKVAVLNVWHDQLFIANGSIEYRGNMIERSRIETESNRRRRALEFDRIVRTAFEEGLPVQLIVMGYRDQRDPFAHADYRELDQAVWNVASYQANGDYLLSRAGPLSGT